METILVYTPDQTLPATFRVEDATMRIRALLAVLALAALAACTSPTAPGMSKQPDTELGFGSPAIGTGL